MNKRRNIETTMYNIEDSNKKKMLTKAILASLAVILLSSIGLFGFSYYRYHRYQDALVTIQETMSDSFQPIQKTTIAMVTSWQKASGATPEDRFDHALASLHNDLEYQANIEKIRLSQYKINKLSKRLQHPPKGFEKINPLFQQVCENYIELSDLVVHPTNDLGTIYKRFDTLYRDTIDILYKIQQEHIID